MKQFLTLLLISTGIFGFSTVTNAQKIGYISADQVIRLMPEAATVQAELKDYQQSLYQNAQDQQDSFNKDLDAFMKDSASMSPSLKEVKRKELAKRSQELGGAQQQIDQELQEKQQELFLPLQQKLQAAIEAVAKENGYKYVFPRNALIVAPDGDDLGSLVKKKLGLKDAPAPSAKP